MWPESQLQSIQYGNSKFLLDISWLPSVLFFHDAYPYQQNLLEHFLGWLTTPSDLCFAKPRRHSSLDHLLGLLGPNPTSSFTNTVSHDSIYPSSDFQLSSDWAPNPSYIQIYNTGPITPTKVMIQNLRKRMKYMVKCQDICVSLVRNICHYFM